VVHEAGEGSKNPSRVSNLGTNELAIKLVHNIKEREDISSVAKESLSYRISICEAILLPLGICMNHKVVIIMHILDFVA
jgi:hypothetical protein